MSIYIVGGVRCARHSMFLSVPSATDWILYNDRYESLLKWHSHTHDERQFTCDNHVISRKMTCVRSGRECICVPRVFLVYIENIIFCRLSLRKQPSSARYAKRHTEGRSLFLFSFAFSFCRPRHSESKLTTNVIQSVFCAFTTTPFIHFPSNILL